MNSTLFSAVPLIDLPFGDLLGRYFYSFSRISGLLIVMPVLSTRLVSVRVRMALCLMLTIIVAPAIQEVPDVDPASLTSFAILMKEFLIGLSIGFILQILFQTLLVGGQIVAMQNGLGFSTLVDPVNGMSVASISQLYLMMANLYFFSINGHLVVIEVIIESFRVMPIGIGSLRHTWYAEVAQMGSWMFAGGLLIALPSVAAMLLVNASFGVVSRLAPQFNIFAVGFPFNMVLGLFIISITLMDLLPQFDRYTQEVLEVIRTMLVS